MFLSPFGTGSVLQLPTILVAQHQTCSNFSVSFLYCILVLRSWTQILWTVVGSHVRLCICESVYDIRSIKAHESFWQRMTNVSDSNNMWISESNKSGQQEFQLSSYLNFIIMAYKLTMKLAMAWYLWGEYSWLSNSSGHYSIFKDKIGWLENNLHLVFQLFSPPPPQHTIVNVMKTK